MSNSSPDAIDAKLAIDQHAQAFGFEFTDVYGACRFPLELLREEPVTAVVPSVGVDAGRVVPTAMLIVASSRVCLVTIAGPREFRFVPKRVVGHRFRLWSEPEKPFDEAEASIHFEHSTLALTYAAPLNETRRPLLPGVSCQEWIKSVLEALPLTP